ncbi:MAG: response regulator [Deltaproteobacteria bacterium]|nr:response regulator [Deltaproteobacteria bacterium]
MVEDSMQGCERCAHLLAELMQQKLRISKLAQENAQLQLIADILQDLTRLRGVVPIAVHTMQRLASTIGGTEVSFYYRHNEGWLRLDVNGREKTLAFVDDQVVADAIATGDVSGPHCTSDSDGLFTMHTGRSTFEKWVFPLSVDGVIFGALCMDGLLVHLNDTIVEQLRIIMSYISLAMNNELLAESQLNQANSRLTQKNQELEDEIENRIRIEAEKEQLQARLQHSQKMEAIGTLAGGIAHDFNNLLSAIIGYTDLVHESCTDVQSRHHLSQVLRASERARELVNQILAFSRKTDMENAPIRIGPVIREVMKLLRASIPATIEIETRLDDNCSAILGNTTHVHQVIMNLCTNAAHAMAERGGRLVVSLGARVDERGRSLVRLSVADSGTGIAPDIMPRIFDPYFTTKEVGKGTGMGLAVVHGIVHSLDGEIQVESTPEKGTVFSCDFPAVEADDRDSVAPTSIAVTWSGVVMVVDDETVIGNLAAEMLKKMGFEVDVFSRSPKALEAFMATPERYSLILTDQTMPEMTGLQLSQHITSRHWLPIIISSGYSNAIDSEQAETCRIAGFIPKPYKFCELEKAVAAALETDGRLPVM